MKQQIFDVVRLRFNGPLHLSRGKEEMDKAEANLHSDKLKSALASAAFLINPQWSQEEKQAFFTSFTVSSAFLFHGDVYLFPKPRRGFPPIVDKKGEEIGKKQKRAQLIDQQFFQQFLLGQLPENLDESQLVHVDPADEESDYILSNELRHREALIKNEVLLRTSVLRHVADAENTESETESRRLFYLDRLFFGPDTGLFFFIHYESDRDKYEPLVKNALSFLADEGIGTDRHTGNGQFDFDPEKDCTTLSFSLPDTGKNLLLLSLFCPLANDTPFNEMLQGSAYQITKRGGYISSPMDEGLFAYRKKAVYMFTEGSIFNHPGQLPAGKIVDLKPDEVGVRHPVWRDGRGFFLPFQ